jgi:hypothetical protein
MDASHASELQYFLEVCFLPPPPSGAAVKIHYKQRKPQAPAGPRRPPPENTWTPNPISLSNRGSSLWNSLKVDGNVGSLSFFVCYKHLQSAKPAKVHFRVLGAFVFSRFVF